MWPSPFQDMISRAVADIIGQHMMSCIFIDTKTPRIIRKIKQGIKFYTRKKRETIIGRRKVIFNRMIASLRITDSRSVLA